MFNMKNKGIFYSLLVMFLWGLLFPSVKKGYAVFGVGSGMGAVGDILTFAGIRFFICGIIICIYAAIKNKGSFKSLKGHLLPVLISGTFAIILHYAFTYIGLNLTGGSKTAILKQLGAVFYICFGALFFPEDKFNLKKALGLILGFGGIISINLGSDAGAFGVGDILIIAASFCTVFSNVTSKKVFKYVEPIVSTGVSQLFGGAVLLIIGFFIGGNPGKFVPVNFEQTGVWLIIIVASIISYCLWFVTVKKENLSKLFIIKFSEPLFSAVFSWLIIDEDIFKWQYLVAFILISLGVCVAEHKPRLCNSNQP